MRILYIQKIFLMLGKEIEQIKAGKKKFHDMKYADGWISIIIQYGLTAEVQFV